MNHNIELIDRLRKEHTLERGQMRELLTTLTDDEAEYLFHQAQEVCRSVYGNVIFLRGLIEFSSYCRNNCYYCGIRRGNKKASRYRLSREQILSCAQEGYKLGFRTIVLQSGEDLWYSDSEICSIIKSIKDAHPDVAVTLSIGEKSTGSYRLYRQAGADRYLLRQETSDPQHYRMLHPEEMTIENRKRCLDDLKKLGYQTGCGIMVGTPGQSVEHVLEDLYYMYEFRPQMVGIGPFLPHSDTPFAGEKKGSVRQTLILLSVIRLMLPSVLLPATTALGTADADGREKGILAGANVVMPNLSPSGVRGKYLLYDGKISSGEEAAQSVELLKERLARIGYRTEVSRGDWREYQDR